MNATELVLFVYGTLRDREILEGVLGRAVAQDDLAEARAHGYRTVYYPQRLYPALIGGGEWTRGRLISGLGQTDIARLDAFEGAEYRRGEIEVTTEDGTVMAQTYFPAGQIGPDSPRWSFETWTRLHRPETIGRYRSEDFQ
ncbi:MAG: hypothetical protein CMJ15_04870 [Pelagibacterium sp.]|uniref:gamma-glutamylcyclotransferase family protein n=1 Tax=uncultured Pelagibacterium sp. TaxID=1159875 RepID=UPI000C5F4E26|nr:hypothetical protein [Pelagibacterium sp.]|tara:strand:- start:9424 stop:9846 length:423 start_codon:yes stop_codon:yes gene_type:complete